MKTYTARNPADALALARGDLGADAVVLRTRTYRRGGLFGVPALGGRPVVEITAVSLAVLKAAAKRREAKSLASAGDPSPHADAAETRLGQSTRGLAAASTPMAGDLIRRTYAAARMDLDGPGAAAAAAAALTDTAIEHRYAASSPAPRTVAAGAPGAASRAVPGAERSVAREANITPVSNLAEELAAVKALVARVAESQDRDAARRSAPELFAAAGEAGAAAYATLIRAEVEDELARRIAEGIGTGADADKDEEGCGKARLEAALARWFETMAKPAEDPSDPSGPSGSAGSSRPAGPAGGAALADYRREPGVDRPLTLALVGPTGVGKTTTVAKLAAQWKLRHGREVGVITLDTYRIGAVEQLRTYCSIIGTELQVAATPEELTERLAALSACDIVLIDTAGRSPRDEARVGELGEFLAVARPHQTHLVLSLAASAGVLRNAVDRFARVGLDRLVLTKCDEAAGCGHALDVLSKAGLPVSFLTTGQEVPHDIEAADPETLARRVCGDAAVAAPSIV